MYMSTVLIKVYMQWAYVSDLKTVDVWNRLHDIYYVAVTSKSMTMQCL